MQRFAFGSPRRASAIDRWSQSGQARFSTSRGIVMSGWRPLIKGYFGVALVVGAVMSSAFFRGE